MVSPSNNVGMDGGALSCPDSEALAAWLDQGISAAERQRIDTHLATCEHCRSLVARAAETVRAVHHAPAGHGSEQLTSGPSERGSSVRTKVLWGASVLAVAAMLAIAIQVFPKQWLPWRSETAVSKLTELAAAVGTDRTVEGRLTGPFAYGPLRAPSRSEGTSETTARWTLFGAAAKVRQAAESDPTATNLHALGVAHLVLGDHELAVRALEDAAAQDPKDARYQSDLSAAYLARARHLERLEDLPRALGAAERALKLDASLLEGHFNRALALEALFLNADARRAWEEYLARDSRSGWADEARQHLEKLPQSGGRPDLGHDSPPPPMHTTTEAGLDWLLRVGLTRWADAIVAGDVERAAREHVALADYAGQLSAQANDTFPLALAALTITGTQAQTQRASSFLALADALVQWDRENTSGAEASLLSACATRDVAVRVICDPHLAVIDVLNRRDGAANQRISAATSKSQQHRWVYPLALAKRVDGYRLLFRGQYAAAATAYAEAYSVFDDSKYLNSAAHIAVQLSELGDLTGTFDEAWRWRLNSLRLTAAAETDVTRYLTRVLTAEVLAKRGEREAAATFINDLDEAYAIDLPPIRRAILYISRTKVSLAVGDLASARSTLQSAVESVSNTSDFRLQRLKPDVLLLMADLERGERRLDSAKKALTEAIAGMGPERSAHRATALIARASLSAHQSEWRDVEGDVSDAIALLKDRVPSSSGVPVRLDDATAAFRAAASLIVADANLQGLRGLQLVERLREMLDGTPSDTRIKSDSDLAAAIDGLQSTEMALFYLIADDSLLVWTITGDGVEFTRRAVTAESIEQVVNVLAVQVNRGPTREDLWSGTLASLYDLLLGHVSRPSAVTELIIVPDGVLNGVPFGALFDTRTNQFLFERASVHVVPNLAFGLGRARGSAQMQPPRVALIVGDPTLSGRPAGAFQRLPRAKAEGAAVAALYRTAMPLFQDHATKTRVLAALPNADVLHFAGHAIATLDARGPRLLLAGDVGDPEAALLSGDLHGRLAKSPHVVLAACETGATSIDRAAGLASLSAAFLRAGAGSVVANLWRVDDSASEVFFLNVHRRLTAGDSAARSVALAQRACRADEQCRRAAPTWIGTAVYGSQ